MSKPYSYGTLAVVIPAFLIALAVRAEVTSHPVFIAVGCLPILFLIALFLNAKQSQEKLAAWFILGLAMVPWGWDLIGQISQGYLQMQIPREPYELLAIGSLQSIVLGLAFLRQTSRIRWAAMFSGMMLTIFCVVMVSRLQIAGVIYGIAFLQAMIIVWWLMGDYWQRLESRFVGPTETVGLGLRSGIIFLSLVLFGVATTIGLALVPQAYRLDGFLPTSGGERWSDDRAVSGLGEGNALVGAQDSADSFGPVDTDLFIEDKQPSLYDIANEASVRRSSTTDSTKRQVWTERKSR